MVLVTNAAARCGNARRAFREMAELGRRFYGSPFLTLAFASNDFGQMGSEQALRDFAARHQFTGLLMAKVHVNGRVALLGRPARASRPSAAPPLFFAARPGSRPRRRRSEWPAAPPSRSPPPPSRNTK